MVEIKLLIQSWISSQVKRLGILEFIFWAYSCPGTSIIKDVPVSFLLVK